MSKPKPANPALSISAAGLASALAQIGAEVDNQPLRWLDGATTRDGAPAFCANQSLIAALQTGKRLRSGRA